MDKLSDIPDDTILRKMSENMRARASQEELNLIKTAMESEKKSRVFKRYQAVYLYLSGKTCQEVADIVGLNKNAVSTIHIKYKRAGLDELIDKPIPGRPSRLNENQKSELKAVIIDKLPSEVGFPAEFNWTAGLISQYVEREYGCKYSIRGITGMLDRMGLSYTRPTYVLAKADKEKQKQFIEEFEKVKKTCWTVKSNGSSL